MLNFNFFPSQFDQMKFAKIRSFADFLIMF